MFKTMRYFLAGALILAFVPGLKAEKNVIKIDGSSTVFPITEAVSEEFMKTEPTQVTVGISGTGGGFKNSSDTASVMGNTVLDPSIFITFFSALRPGTKARISAPARKYRMVLNILSPFRT
jgi:hypothetical protein